MQICLYKKQSTNKQVVIHITVRQIWDTDVTNVIYPALKITVTAGHDGRLRADSNVMAIRYSGDVELRIQYGGASQNSRGVTFNPRGHGFYYTSIRAPYIRNAAILSTREVGLSRKQEENPTSSDAYDTAALAFFKWAEIHLGELPLETDRFNRITVRRVFHSPCPVKADR